MTNVCIGDFGSRTTPRAERSKADKNMEPSVIGGGIAAFVLVFAVIIPLGSGSATPDLEYPTPAEQPVQQSTR